MILGPNGFPIPPDPPPKPEPPKLVEKEFTRSHRKQVNNLVTKLNKARIPNLVLWFEDGKFHINCAMGGTKEEKINTITKLLNENL